MGTSLDLLVRCFRPAKIVHAEYAPNAMSMTSAIQRS
jgi:hypothetical protein